MSKSKKPRRGRGEGSIRYDDQRGCWVGTITVGYDPETRKQTRKVCYGATKKAVQEKLLGLQTRKAQGTLETSKITVNVFLAEWLDNAVHAVVDPPTEHQYRQRVNDFIPPHFGHVKLVELHTGQVQSLLRTLEEKQVSPEMRKKVGELLRRALKYAVSRRYVRENVAMEARLPKTEIDNPQPLDEAQVKQFLATARTNRLFPFYVLALDTGMRQGELMALEWTDLDLQSGYVHVNKTLKTGVKGGPRIKDVKTRAGCRRIKLTAQSIQVLAAWRVRSPGKLVFPAQRRGIVARESYLHKGNVTKSFKKLLRAAKLPPIRFHDLRHTHATLALLKTKNIKAISARLGHKDITVTLKVYARWMPAMEDEIVVAMGEILSVAV